MSYFLSNSTRVANVVKPIAVALGLMGSIAAAQAATINSNLTTDGASATINGATFTAFDSSGSVGTGNFPAFVKIQGNTDVTEGYNTNGAATLDTGNAPLFTFLLADMERFTVAGVEYVRFGLDINESQAQRRSLLSLDNVEIFLSGSATLGGHANCWLGGVTCLYAMDSAATDNNLLLDAALNSGSGNGVDLFFDLPTAVFGGADANSNYVYLYSRFGGVAGYENSGGFEEWNYLRCETPNGCGGSSNVPVPAPLALVGLGLLGLRLAKPKK
jgi:hypothetical protein